MGFYETFDGLQLLAVQAEILRQPDFRLKPEFRFPASAGDMDVHAWFLAREEIESEATLPEDRWSQVDA
jgi:hypothetical protein